jgi:hypothetical protein
MVFLVATVLAGSLAFDKEDANGRVVCGDLLNIAEGTIEFWFKPFSNLNNEWVISKSKDDGKQMMIGFGPADFMFMVKDGEWTYAAVKKETIPLDEWHHVACVFQKDQATIFIDGTAYRNHRPGAYRLNHLAGGEFMIGRGTTATERFNGLVAEVRLSDCVCVTRRISRRPPRCLRPTNTPLRFGIWTNRTATVWLMPAETSATPGRMGPWADGKIRHSCRPRRAKALDGCPVTAPARRR